MERIVGSITINGTASRLMPGVILSYKKGDKMKTHETTTAESLANAAGERAKSYVDAGVDALNTVSGKARQIGRTTDDCVRDNPWIAVGVAAGVGIVVGFLLRGRRSA